MKQLHSQHTFGVWRSLVARFVRDEEVVGSNPATPTHEIQARIRHLGGCLPPKAVATQGNCLSKHLLFNALVVQQRTTGVCGSLRGAGSYRGWLFVQDLSPSNSAHALDE